MFLGKNSKRHPEPAGRLWGRAGACWGRLGADTAKPEALSGWGVL